VIAAVALGTFLAGRGERAAHDTQTSVEAGTPAPVTTLSWAPQPSGVAEREGSLKPYPLVPAEQVSDDLSSPSRSQASEPAGTDTSYDSGRRNTDLAVTPRHRLPQGVSNSRQIFCPFRTNVVTCVLRDQR
jgi:hypothetical protein